MNHPETPLEQLIVPTRLSTFSLVACGQGGDYETGGSLGAYLSRLRTFLHRVEASGYDLCIIDTAAGLFGLTADVISTSHAVMIPQQAEPLGIRSIPKLLEGLNRLKVMNPRLTVLGVCLTMVQNDLPESVDAANALRKLLPAEMVFESQVPRDPVFVKASARGLPVGVLEDGANMQLVFDRLRVEIDRKLQPATRPHGSFA